MPGVEAITARNSAGYDAPIGLTADPVVFTLVGDRLSVLLARRLEEPQRGCSPCRAGSSARRRRPRRPRSASCARRRASARCTWSSCGRTRSRARSARLAPVGGLPRAGAPEALPEEGGPAGREAGWSPVDDLPELALDHETIVDDGLWRLRARVAEKTWFLRVAAALLPERSSRSARRSGSTRRCAATPVDAANFRRDVKATGLLVDTGEVHSDGPGARGGSTCRRRARRRRLVPAESAR